MRAAFRLATFLFALTLVLVYFGAGSEGLLGGASATPSPSGSPCLSAVTLDGTDSFTWSETNIGPVCNNVNFTLVNTGTVSTHSFTITNQINTTETALGAFEAPNDLYDYETLTPGQTVTVFVHFNATGFYDFTCKPHFTLGMRGVIYVNLQPPAATGGTSSPSFEPFWIIVAIIATLAVLAVVGGLIYGKAGEHSSQLDPDAPLTSRPEYFNDSRPEPLDSVEPMKRGEE